MFTQSIFKISLEDSVIYSLTKVGKKMKQNKALIGDHLFSHLEKTALPSKKKKLHYYLNSTTQFEKENNLNHIP